ncbi:hypothetical protein [Myxosarcina sp. GI1(2024)]
MSWLSKLSNWLSGGVLDRYREQARLAKAKLRQTELQVESLQDRLQQAHKELAQSKAQEQINRGFQIELVETQVRLKKIQDEYSNCQQQLLNSEQQLKRLQTQLQQASSELAVSQDWLQQLNTPVEVLEIEKTLPKQEFNTFWGFGITSPQPKTRSTAGSIIFRGWVLGKKSAVELVKISYREQTILEVPANLPSPGITQQYPDIPQAARSGFEFSLTVAGITSPAKLNLFAVLSNRSVIPLCTFILK